MERKVLGKGLSALIPEKKELGASTQIIEIEISRIRQNRYQPRCDVNKETLQELVNSIKEKGVVQPVLVRPIKDGNFELIAGERRLRAVKELGFSKIPATVREVGSDIELLQLSLIENIQREDLNPIEEAQAYQRLSEEFGNTLDMIASAVGKDKGTISNTIRLLRLPKQVQDCIKQGLISQGHGRALLTLGDLRQQIELCERIIKKGLSVREVEIIVQRRERRLKAPQKKDSNIIELEEELQRILGTKVRITHFKKRGRIQIEYFSLEGLDRLLKLLRSVSKDRSY